MVFAKRNGGKFAVIMHLISEMCVIHVSSYDSATALKETTATSGGTERRSYPRDSNPKRNNRSFGAGQSALKLENPMKLQKIPTAPQPRRENSRPSGNGQRASDNGPRVVASAGADGTNVMKGAGRGASKSDDNVDEFSQSKPRKPFDGSRFDHLKRSKMYLRLLVTANG